MIKWARWSLLKTSDFFFFFTREGTPVLWMHVLTVNLPEPIGAETEFLCSFLLFHLSNSDATDNNAWYVHNSCFFLPFKGYLGFVFFSYTVFVMHQVWLSFAVYQLWQNHFTISWHHFIMANASWNDIVSYSVFSL